MIQLRRYSNSISSFPGWIWCQHYPLLRLLFHFLRGVFQPLGGHPGRARFCRLLWWIHIHPGHGRRQGQREARREQGRGKAVQHGLRRHEPTAGMTEIYAYTIHLGFKANLPFPPSSFWRLKSNFSPGLVVQNKKERMLFDWMIDSISYPSVSFFWNGHLCLFAVIFNNSDESYELGCNNVKQMFCIFIYIPSIYILCYSRVGLPFCYF